MPDPASVTATCSTLGCTANRGDVPALAGSGTRAGDRQHRAPAASRRRRARGDATRRALDPAVAVARSPHDQAGGRARGDHRRIEWHRARDRAAGRRTRGEVSLIARDPARLAAAAADVGATATASADVARGRCAPDRARHRRGEARPVRRADHVGRVVAPRLLRAARRRGVPRPDGGRLLRHAARDPRRRARR